MWTESELILFLEAFEERFSELVGHHWAFLRPIALSCYDLSIYSTESVYPRVKFCLVLGKTRIRIQQISDLQEGQTAFFDHAIDRGSMTLSESGIALAVVLAAALGESFDLRPAAKAVAWAEVGF